jgi:hypothetical protein
MKRMNWNKHNKDKRAKELTSEKEADKRKKKLHGYDVMKANTYTQRVEKWKKIIGPDYRPNPKKYKFENGKIDVNKVQESLRSQKSSEDTEN